MNKNESKPKAALIIVATMSCMILCSTVFAQNANTNQPGNNRSDAALEEIVVTATRREESLSKVPASIATFSQEKMDIQGIRQIEDIAKLTPGLTFQRESRFTGGNTNIAIRGISSNTAAGTTGIYIDDVPIQSRIIGFATANVYPKTFDIERVEVLRGPQGTLFGAGAEGGAVRFITPKPSLSQYSIYARSEFASTEEGDTSTELGVAVGGPISENVLGFRVSAWTREDGGYIDRIDHRNGMLAGEDVNSDETSAVKATLTWQPTEQLSITPSIYTQSQDIADTLSYWELLSDSSSSDFVTGQVQAQPLSDDFTITSLNAEYYFETMTLISTTSRFEREVEQSRDYTNFAVQIFFPDDPFAQYPDQIATGFFTEEQDNFTQELRLQSSGNQRWNWVVGLFYSEEEQDSTQTNQDSFYDQMIIDLFGPAFSIAADLLPGDILYDTLIETDTTQKAVFGQVDVALTDRLTLTAGLRWADYEIEHRQFAEGIWAGEGGIDLVAPASATSTTPKLGLSFQADEDNLFYTTLSKGFRPGGGQGQVPSNLTATCPDEFVALGLDGLETPIDYDPDETTAFEIGSKNSLLNGRLTIDANIYQIKWKDIQTAIPLCESSFITNGPEATSRGVDLVVQALLGSNFTLSLVVGHNVAEFDKRVASGAGAIIIEKGDPVDTSAPEFSYTLSGQYDFNLLNNSAFLRLDYSYADEAKARSSNVFDFDPELTQSDELSLINLRGGVSLVNNVDVSVFINNVTGEQPEFYRFRFNQFSPLFTNTTLRPRTIGVNAMYRY